MKNAFALILFLIGIGLAIWAVQTYQEATASMEILGIELAAKDKIAQKNAVMYGAGALLCFILGFLSWRKG